MNYLTILLIVSLFALTVSGQNETATQASVVTQMQSPTTDNSCLTNQESELHSASMATTIDEANLEMIHAQAYQRLSDLGDTCQ